MTIMVLHSSPSIPKCVKKEMKSSSNKGKEYFSLLTSMVARVLIRLHTLTVTEVVQGEHLLTCYQGSLHPITRLTHLTQVVLSNRLVCYPV